MLLTTGIFAGSAAGLFGIGGGIIVVPALEFIFLRMGFPLSIAMHVAIGTSLGIMITTSLASVITHHRRGAVRWDIFRKMVLGIAVGACLGTVAISQLPGKTLHIAFAVFLFISAIQLFMKLRPKKRPHLPHLPFFSLIASLIGFIAAALGIGGSIMTVPLLVIFDIDILFAIATASACSLPIAIVGSLTSIYTGWHHPLLPSSSIGFVDLKAVIIVTITSMLFAYLGARLAHRTNPVLLRSLFAFLLIFISLQMFFTAF